MAETQWLHSLQAVTVWHRLADISAEQHFFFYMQHPSHPTTDGTVEHVITDRDESQLYD